VAGSGLRLTGDFAKLRGLVNKLKDLSSKGPITKISVAVSEEALALVRRGFRAEQDPYGNAWAPLKHRKGKILRDTGRMANGFTRVRATATGFTLANNTDYASVHQHGASYTAGAGSTSRRKGRFVSGQTLARKGTTKRGRLRKGYQQVSHGAHQVVIPARRMVPTEAQGLGHWQAPLERAARRAMHRILRGK
jgi:phage gpG-like protein